MFLSLLPVSVRDYQKATKLLFKLSLKRASATGESKIEMKGSVAPIADF